MLGEGTAVVNGQRTVIVPQAAYVPTSFGAQTSGVPNVTPIVPPYASAVGGPSASPASGYASVNGYGTAENNGMQTSIAANNPHNWKASPTWWAVGALVIGLTLLGTVSWHETVDAEGGKVKADAGGGA
jgi:hypothetical protein